MSNQELNDLALKLANDVKSKVIEKLSTTIDDVSDDAMEDYVKKIDLIIVEAIKIFILSQSEVIGYPTAVILNGVIDKMNEKLVDYIVDFINNYNKEEIEKRTQKNLNEFIVFIGKEILEVATTFIDEDEKFLNLIKDDQEVKNKIKKNITDYQEKLQKTPASTYTENYNCLFYVFYRMYDCLVRCRRTA